MKISVNGYKNSLKNKDIEGLSKCCDELYIIGVRA